MPRQPINNFAGGLVTFQSELDLREDQYQTFSDVDNSKLGVIQKPKINVIKTAVDTANIETDEGRGFLTYRTQYDAANAQTSTQWYVYSDKAALSTGRIRRYDSSDGTGGSWANILSSSEWTSLLHNSSYLVHDDILRISDGNFATSNTTQWYGHIKRDIFGEGVTYSTSERFSAPGDASAENSWNAISTDLTPPTVVEMTSPFDGGDTVDAVNKVGLFIHYPSDGTGDYEVMDDLTDDTFFSLDRYTVIFQYDYAQDSALAKNSDGTIGVLANNWASGYKKVPPVINVVMNTTSFNKRITGLSIYWKPFEVGGTSNVDWYHVIDLDINNAWKDDYRATDISAYTLGTFGAKNMGYWIPCPDIANVRGSGSRNLILASGSGDTSSASLWVLDTKSTSVFDYQSTDIFWAGTSTNYKTVLTMTDTQIGIPTVVADGASDCIVTFGGSDPITYRDQTNALPATDTAGAGLRHAYAAPVDANKVATWYIPNDGVLASTYNSVTGRAAEQVIESHRWVSAVVIGNRAFYGNVKTKDENEQDVIYDSRVYHTSPGLLDEVYAFRFFDVSRKDGDKIVALEAWGSRLFVFKERGVYIYNVGGGKIYEEKRLKGIGAHNRNAITQTPFGIIACDVNRVSLITPSSAVELSYTIRKTWQGLTLDRPSVSYDAINNRIIIVTDSDATTTNTFYIYDFDTKSWSNEKYTSLAAANTLQKLSNLILGDNLYPLVAEDFQDAGGDDYVRVIEIGSSGTFSDKTAIIKSKRFDFGIPDMKKRFNRIYLTYKAGGNVTAKLFTNGNTTESGTEYKALTFASQSTKTCSGKYLKMVGKTLEVQIECAETDFELDDIQLDYDMIGRNP